MKLSFGSLSTVVLLSVFVSALSGCAHGILTAATPTDPCISIDWWEAGRNDGAAGLTQDRVDAQEKQCAAKSKDPNRLALYSNGFEAGLVDFCTPSQGLEAGRANQAYEHICPPNLESGFMTGFEKGKRISQLEKENSEIEKLINSINRSISSVNSSTPPGQIDQLRKRRAQIENEITGLEHSSD